MSQARVYTTKGPVRKDGLVCGKCRQPIRKGIDRRRTFAVGYRGYEQTRCMKPECTPTRSELESSLLSSVYDVIDGLNIDSIDNTDDFTSARDQVVEALNDVASEYEGNEMFDINEDLQERVSTLEGAASELENWEPENDEPQEDDFDDEDSEFETFEEAHEAWLEETRESLTQAIDEMELP